MLISCITEEFLALFMDIFRSEVLGIKPTTPSKWVLFSSPLVNEVTGTNFQKAEFSANNIELIFFFQPHNDRGTFSSQYLPENL